MPVNNLAIIPARGGSKRIPRKNIKKVRGIPMLGNAIRTTIDSGLFERVIVSTDDHEIAEIALTFGAEIPRLRSTKLSDDHTSTIDVIADALTDEWIGCIQPKFVCVVYPTTPLLMSSHLQKAFQILISSSYDYVFPAIPYSHPPQRAFTLNVNNGIANTFSQYMNIRTQDSTKFFHDSGQFYWGKFESWKNKLPIISENSGVMLMNLYDFIDIDVLEDLKMVETILELRNQ